MSVSCNPTSDVAATVILRQSSCTADNCGTGFAIIPTTILGRGFADHESPVNVTMWPDPAASSNPTTAQDRTATSKSSSPYTLTTVSGLSQPQWSRDEDSAIPLFRADCVGELSVRWDPLLDAWICLYNADWPADRSSTGGIVMHWTKSPYGP